LTASEPAADKPWPGLRKPGATKAPETFKAPVPYEDESLRADDGGMRRPANDDRESIGSILRALQQTPSRTSYVLASVFAGVWIVAGFALGFLYIPEIQRALGPTGLTAPVLAVLAAIDGRGRDAARRARDRRARFDRHRGSSNPARGRRHGRRHRARAGARRRARDARRQ
jgi:hypothetical protein